MSESRLQLRPATLDDAAGVADLQTARTPDDPRDAAMGYHPVTPVLEVHRRLPK